MEIELKSILPSGIFGVIDRAGIATPKQILTLSELDIKKLTNLNKEDIHLLKMVIADKIGPRNTDCKELLKIACSRNVTTGVIELNNILNGGFRRGTLTEIYGESGSGKTQLVIQACLHSYPASSVYICTEDVFPIRRYEEMKQGLPNYDPQVDYGKLLYVEHITEARDLLYCIRVRLPKLLTEIKCSLIVLDSVAAPFRVDNTNYVQRAEDLRELALVLINMAQQFDLAVVCINQVTSSFSGNVDVLPSLGLAWSNMICTRLWIKKLHNHDPYYNSQVRNMSVIFAPDLPNYNVNLVITSQGLQPVIY